MIKFSPTAKILLYIILITSVFLSSSLEIDLCLLLIVVFFALRLPLSVLIRGLIPIMIFLGFTFFSNTLFQTGKIVFEVLGVTITEEGLMRGSHLTLRLLILILGAKLLTTTTSADDLVRSMTFLLGPVGRWAPVKEFIATLSLTLRFLPLIYDEARTFYSETFKNSQEKSFLDKIKLAVTLLVPLFERSIKRAKELSNRTT